MRGSSSHLELGRHVPPGVPPAAGPPRRRAARGAGRGRGRRSAAPRTRASALVVAAHAARRRSRAPSCGPASCTGEPDDGLASSSSTRSASRRLRTRATGRQRAHLDARRARRAAAAGRSAAEQPRRRAGASRRASSRAGRAVEQREPAASCASVTPVGVQAPVEGVVDRAVAGAARPGAQLEVPAERRSTASRSGPSGSRRRASARASLASHWYASARRRVPAPDPLTGRPRRPARGGQGDRNVLGNVARLVFAPGRGAAWRWRGDPAPCLVGGHADMTARKHLKHLVRERMRRTGERYTVARRHVRTAHPAWELRGGVARRHGGVRQRARQPRRRGRRSAALGGDDPGCRRRAGRRLHPVGVRAARLSRRWCSGSGASGSTRTAGRGGGRAARAARRAARDRRAKGAAAALDAQLDRGLPAIAWIDTQRARLRRAAAVRDGYGGPPVVVYGARGDRYAIDDCSPRRETVPGRRLAAARGRVPPTSTG